MTEKVSFNGAARRITVLPGVTDLDIRADIYSAWKRWSQVGNNLAFLPAMRTIGGDPVGGGQYAGDMYFLMNGWQIEVDQIVRAAGILYHDDGISPVTVLPGGGFTLTVSNLAIGFDTSGAPAPTAEQVAQTVWSRAIEGLNAEQVMRILLAALAGRTEGLGTSEEHYLAQDGVTPRISATFDAAGNRLQVDLDGTS